MKIINKTYTLKFIQHILPIQTATMTSEQCTQTFEAYPEDWKTRANRVKDVVVSKATNAYYKACDYVSEKYRDGFDCSEDTKEKLTVAGIYLGAFVGFASVYCVSRSIANRANRNRE